MAQQIINIGTAPSGAGGDTPRAAWYKASLNFNELYSLTGQGGVVQSGTVSNGSYVKFADGTIICRGISANAVTTNTAFGNGLFYSAPVGFNFPIAFSGVPSVVVQSITANGFFCWGAFEGGASTTSAGCRAISGISTATTYLCYIAVGR